MIAAGYTVDAVDGQQGITFAAPPNGARDYTVVFRARRHSYAGLPQKNALPRIRDAWGIMAQGS